MFGSNKLAQAYGKYQRLFRSLTVFRWVAVVAVILVALPLAKGFNASLASIFDELRPGAVFLAVMAAATSSWSLMLTAGLLVEGAETRIRHDGREHRRTSHDGGPLSPWVERNFGVPLRPFQMGCAFALAAPAACVAAASSQAGPAVWLCLPGGLLATWFLVELLAAPVRAALPSYAGPHGPLGPVHRVLERIARALVVPVQFARFVRALVTRIADLLGFDDMLDRDEDGVWRLAPVHFFALCGMFGTFLVLAVFAFAFAPPATPENSLPTAALLYVLLTLTIWLGAGLEYHLSRYGLPVIVLLFIGAAISTWFSNHADHGYRVEPIAIRPDVDPPGVSTGDGGARVHPGLSPLEVAAANDEENLVVVCAAGGGILAAGWTALAFQELVARRPELSREIRVVSSVSGGSVGTAYYLHGLAFGWEGAEGSAQAWTSADKQAWNDVGSAFVAGSVDSSLSAVTYGLVFPDFLRLVTAGWSERFIEVDRGSLLEGQWLSSAQRRLQAPDAPWRFAELVPAIRSGRIPAPIFNTTAMESGRRVMITPIVFPRALIGLGRDLRHGPRADTLSEYLLGEEDGRFADLSIWTAARLSATFPYVTPAARWKSPEEEEADQRAGHHMIDGGYYDNFGVASALDWVRVILEHRLDHGSGCSHLPAFRRLAIVQLRAFPVGEAADIPPSSSFLAALAGPLLGIANIRNGAAISRNAIELDHFLDAWSARLDDLELESFVIQPEEGVEQGPLSWRLTSTQVDDMKLRWLSPRVDVEVARLLDFLGADAD